MRLLNKFQQGGIALRDSKGNIVEIPQEEIDEVLAEMKSEQSAEQPSRGTESPISNRNSQTTSSTVPVSRTPVQVVTPVKSEQKPIVLAMRRPRASQNEMAYYFSPEYYDQTYNNALKVMRGNYGNADSDAQKNRWDRMYNAGFSSTETAAIQEMVNKIKAGREQDYKASLETQKALDLLNSPTLLQVQSTVPTQPLQVVMPNVQRTSADVIQTVDNSDFDSLDVEDLYQPMDDSRSAKISAINLAQKDIHDAYVDALSRNRKTKNSNIKAIENDRDARLKTATTRQERKSIRKDAREAKSTARQNRRDERKRLRGAKKEKINELKSKLN